MKNFLFLRKKNYFGVLWYGSESITRGLLVVGKAGSLVFADG